MSYIYPNVGGKVARMKDLAPVLDGVAEEVERLMIGVAVDHIDSGDYIDSIGITVDRSSPSKQDRFVGPSDEGALSIEYGYTEDDGTVRDGQHIIEKTVAAVPRV